MGRLDVLSSAGMAVLPGYGAVPAGLRGRGGGIESLYLHVPFCSSKCHYCDFYSLAGHLDRAGEFLDALEREMAIHATFFGEMMPRTIFIGGGTPTLLPAGDLERLLRLLHRYFRMSGVEEFTVEANPNTFSAATARTLKAGGVNRVSFGAQSFNRDELAMLQRDHDPEAVAPAFAAARDAGIDNLNVDLIFGIPGQSVASWEYSLARAIELEPSHMSCYSLIYESNTAMTARLKRGDFSRIDEETELAMFEHVYRRLGDAGFTRYETSNYSRIAPCSHNLVYWKAGNWLGLGPSAGSHFAGGAAGGEVAAWQWKNAGSLAHYLEQLVPGAGSVPITQMESLSRVKWAAGAAVFWLRLSEGLAYRAFEERTGVDARPVLEKVLRPFVDLGMAEIGADRAVITDKGVAVSDHILARVLSAMENKLPK